MKINIDNGKALKDIIIDEEENIYQKLARATARALDINLGKTTLADLLDGYTKSITLQKRIDKVNEYLYSNDFVYDELYKKREKINKILGDKDEIITY